MAGVIQIVFSKAIETISLLWVLHLGYGWLSLGFLLLAFNGLVPILPQTI
jgi:uncharacterized protein involved in response to NO